MTMGDLSLLALAGEVLITTLAISIWVLWRTQR